MPQEKFAPLPSKIVIRTMEKDLEALQKGGGELPHPSLPEEIETMPPVSDFLQQSREEASADNETIAPPPPILQENINKSHSGASFKPSANPTTTKAKAQSNGLKGLLLVLGGMGTVLALGAIGYFLILPMVRGPQLTPPLAGELTPTPTPPVAVTPTPPPLPPAPSIALAMPADEVIEINLPTPNRNVLIAEIKTIATREADARSFKEIQVRSGNRWLSAEEIALMLFNNLPREISAALANTYSIFIYWQDPETAFLGIYLSLNPALTETASVAAMRWEETIEADALAFFLERLERAPNETAAAFRDQTYRNIPFRFSSLRENIGISHAIAANTFIFTSHRDTMHEAIRRLTEI